MARRILLIGCDGQLGWSLHRSLAPLGEVVPAGRRGAPYPGFRRLDLEAPGSIRATLEAIAPDLVVNAAAYTAVDRAEEEPDRAAAVNAAAPRALADFARRRGARLVHFSTDYVFSGAGDTPWTETDSERPTGVYGRTKAEGERGVRESGAEHLILRTAWLYAPRGRNFVKAILARAESGQALRVVDDQTGSPTSAGFLAQASALAIARWLDGAAGGGTYHLSAAGQCTWYEFACAVLAGRFGPDHPVAVTPVPSREYPTRAERPKFSVLDCGRFDAAFGLHRPTWQAQLAAVLEEIGAPR